MRTVAFPCQPLRREVDMKRRRCGTHLGAAAVLWTAVTAGVLLADGGVYYLDSRAGEVAFTVVGEVTNTSPDQSSQFGYLPSISGLTDLFSGPTQDETTAYFTFFTQATTKAVRHDGPLTIIEREGTTTVYLNVSPHATFDDPATLKDGEVVLVMELTQQVIVDTSSGLFTVVDVNDVVTANSFERGGDQYVVAREGSQLRTTLTGHLSTTAPPSGYFAGYAVLASGGVRGSPRVVPFR